MRLTSLPVDEEAKRLLLVLISHDPDRQQHRLAGQAGQQRVDLHVAAASRHVTLVNGASLHLLHRAAGVGAGIFSRHTELFDDRVVQINLFGRHARVKVKRTQCVSFIRC